VDVRHAVAEDLPFDDATIDRTVSQLAVHFFTDPVAGLREMSRVTRPGGLVAAAVWDLGARDTPLAVFWDAAKRLEPSAHDESGRAGTQKGQFAELLRAADLKDVEESVLVVSTSFDDFDRRGTGRFLCPRP
jgi:ubiquinone/menaquinone biosynthesis C-methylase UbiE